jgi:hypothetical protein
MGRSKRILAIATAALLGACATADQYRDACRYTSADPAEIDDCANKRAEEANTQTGVLVVLGVVAVGAIAAAAASSGGSSNNNNEMFLRCLPLGCPPMTPR